MRRFPEAGASSMKDESPGQRLEKRVEKAASYMLEDRTGRSVTISSVEIYHTRTAGDSLLTRSLVLTPATVYLMEIQFDTTNKMFKGFSVELEIPRGRKDFQARVVTDTNGMTQIHSSLGEMRLPSVLIEKGDTINPDALALRLAEYVSTGESGWQESTLPQVVFDDSDTATVEQYVKLMHFEMLLRNCFVRLLEEKYGNQLTDRIKDILKGDYDKVIERMNALAKRYGKGFDCSDINVVFQYLGFENYITLIEDNNLWEKSIVRVFGDRHQMIEGLRIIRDVRNEVAHFRPRIHPELWSASNLYIDTLTGKILMEDSDFKKLVEKVGTLGPDVAGKKEGVTS